MYIRPYVKKLSNRNIEGGSYSIQNIDCRIFFAAFHAAEI